MTTAILVTGKKESFICLYTQSVCISALNCSVFFPHYSYKYYVVQCASTVS